MSYNQLKMKEKESTTPPVETRQSPKPKPPRDPIYQLFPEHTDLLDKARVVVENIALGQSTDEEIEEQFNQLFLDPEDEEFLTNDMHPELYRLSPMAYLRKRVDYEIAEGLISKSSIETAKTVMIEGEDLLIDETANSPLNNN